jgi:oligopeptide/dipeptide ABC transporter ATP-binding protein
MTDPSTLPDPMTADVMNHDDSDDVQAPPLLSIRDLRVHFDSKHGLVQAVDGVTLDVRDGETLGLVGETGSGKSVTAKSVLRLVPSPPGVYAGGQALFRPRQQCTGCEGAGCVACDERGRVPMPCGVCAGAGGTCSSCEGTGRHTVDLLQLPLDELRRIRGNRIAMIFQDPGKALNPALSVRAQIAEVFAEHRSQELLEDAGLDRGAAGAAAPLLRRAARMRSRGPEKIALRLPPLRSMRARLDAALDERIARTLADTRIPNPRKVMNSFPHELSGGMKQRVMIAQGLACDPDLLIADEPTTALDVTIQARILDLIEELQDRHGTSVLYISHDLSLVRTISDRVAVMYAGRLAEIGDTASLFADPRHPYTRGLLAAIPTRKHTRGGLTAIEGNVPDLVDIGAQCRFHTRCPQAAAACATVDPAWTATEGGQHRTACLLYQDHQSLGVPAEAMPRAEEPA